MGTAISITNEDQLDKLLRAISWELVQADVFLKLRDDLQKSIPEYVSEMNNSNTFWHLTFDGLLDACMIRLCRAFDSDKKASSLPNLLLTIRNNRHFFAESLFRLRMEGRDIEEAVLSKDNVPSIEAIDYDLERTSRRNSKVRDLIEWRGNVYAHRNWERVVRAEDFENRPVLSLEDISELLKMGLDIVNNYSRLFKIHSYSSQIVGHDDFRFVLRSIRGEVRRMRERFDHDMATFGPKTEGEG